MEIIKLNALLIFIGFGLLGMVAHYVKKRGRGEVAGSPIDYFLADYPGRTVATITAFLAASLTAATTGAINGLDPSTFFAALRHGGLHVPSMSVMVSAFTLGWMFDSGINKGL